MEEIITLLNIADIETKINGTTKLEKMEYLRNLTAEQQLLYRRYKDNQRQKRYKENPENRKKANELSKERMRELRSGEPEKYAEMNREHNKKYNEKLKALKSKADAVKTLTDAIKARKARREMAKLKAEKEAKVIKRKRGRPSKQAK